MLYSIVLFYFNSYLLFAEVGNWYISLASGIRLMFHEDRQLWYHSKLTFYEIQVFQSDFPTISWITYSFDDTFSLRNIQLSTSYLERLVHDAESSKEV